MTSRFDIFFDPFLGCGRMVFFYTKQILLAAWNRSLMFVSVACFLSVAQLVKSSPRFEFYSQHHRVLHLQVPVGIRSLYFKKKKTRGYCVLILALHSNCDFTLCFFQTNTKFTVTWLEALNGVIERPECRCP
jgi:hypothetical protein